MIYSLKISIFDNQYVVHFVIVAVKKEYYFQLVVQTEYQIDVLYKPVIHKVDFKTIFLQASLSFLDLGYSLDLGY